MSIKNAVIFFLLLLCAQVVSAGYITSLSKSPLRSSDTFFVVWRSEQSGVLATLQIATMSESILFTETVMQEENYGSFESRLLDIIPTITEGQYQIRISFPGEAAASATMYVVTAPVIPIAPLSGTIPLLSMSWTPSAPYYHLVVSDQEVSITENSDGTYTATGLNVVWQTITPTTSAIYGSASTTLDVTPPPLLPGRKYSWIAFKNFTGKADTTAFILSPVSIITAGGTQTPRLTLLAPTENAEITDTLTLSCPPQIGALRYEYYIYKKAIDLGNDSSDFEASGLLFSTTSVNPSITLTSASCLTTPGEYMAEVFVHTSTALYATHKVSFTYSTATPENIVQLYVRDSNTKSVIPYTEIVVARDGYSPHSYYADNNGYLELTLPHGDYLFTARHIAYTSQTKMISLYTATTAVYELHPNENSVILTVIDDDNLPVTDATVAYYKDGSLQKTQITSSAGIATSYLPQGEYSVVVSKTGYDTHAITLSLSQDTTQSLQLKKASTATLTVMKTGSVMIQGAQIYTVVNGTPSLIGVTSSAGTITVPVNVPLWIIATGLVPISIQVTASSSVTMMTPQRTQRVLVQTLQGASLQKGVVFFRNITTGNVGASLFNASSSCEIGLLNGIYDVIVYGTIGEQIFVSKMYRLTNDTPDSILAQVEPATYHTVKIVDYLGVGIADGIVSTWHAYYITNNEGYAHIPANPMTTTMYSGVKQGYYSSAMEMVGAGTTSAILYPFDSNTIEIRGKYIYSDFAPLLVIAERNGVRYSASITPTGYALKVPPGTYTIDAKVSMNDIHTPRTLSVAPSPQPITVSQLQLPVKYASYRTQFLDAVTTLAITPLVSYNDQNTTYITHASPSGYATVYAATPTDIKTTYPEYSSASLSVPFADTTLLYKGNKFTITVQDPLGSPISGAIVQYSGKTVTTSSLGRVEIYAPSGSFTYTIAHPEKVSQTHTVVLPDSTAQTHTLYPALGEVTMEIAAHPGSEITLKIGTYTATIMAISPYVTHTVTLPYNVYSLSVSAANHLPITKSITVNSPARTETVTLPYNGYAITITVDSQEFPVFFELQGLSDTRLYSLSEPSFTTPLLPEGNYTARVYREGISFAPATITVNPKDGIPIHFTGSAIVTEQNIIVTASGIAVPNATISFTTPETTYLRTTNAIGECSFPAQSGITATVESLSPGITLHQSSFITDSSVIELTATLSFASLLIQANVSGDVTVSALTTDTVIYSGELPVTVPVVHGETYSIKGDSQGYLSDESEITIAAPTTTHTLHFSEAKIHELVASTQTTIVRNAPIIIDVYALTAFKQKFKTPYSFSLTPHRAGSLALIDTVLQYTPAQDYIGPVTITVTATESNHTASLQIAKEAILIGTSAVKKFFIADTDIEVGMMTYTGTTPFALSLRQKPNKYRSFSPKGVVLGNTLYAIDAATPVAFYTSSELYALNNASEWYKPEKQPSLVSKYMYEYTQGHFFTTATTATKFEISGLRSVKNPYSPRSNEPLKLSAHILSPRSAIITVTATLFDTAMRQKSDPVVGLYTIGDVTIQIPVQPAISTGRYYVRIDISDGVETERKFLLVHCIR